MAVDMVAVDMLTVDMLEVDLVTGATPEVLKKCLGRCSHP
jgi:hypothetical protein